jgi:protein-S-isoprenylcysteine O-methyltransferase Ste14
MSLENIGVFVWLAGVLAGNLIRLPYYKDHYMNSVQFSQKDFREYLVMSSIALGFVFLPIFWIYFDFMIAYRWPQSLLTLILGICLAPISLWFFYRSHFDLKKQWSPSLEIRKDHELVTHGVYQITRNPMYFAVLVWAICQILLIPHFVAGFAAMLSLIPLFIYRLPREEKMMSQHFGQSYLEYKNKTRRIIPFVY